MENECVIYKLNTLKKYEFVIILSEYNGKILLSRHRNRRTWETQGGHIEKGETPLEAAKRELYEESGAVQYEIELLCDYWYGNVHKNAGAGGQVFHAKINRLGELPDSEMEEVKLFYNVPENLTYPDITPVLFAKIGYYRSMLEVSRNHTGT